MHQRFGGWNLMKLLGVGLPTQRWGNKPYVNSAHKFFEVISLVWFSLFRTMGGVRIKVFSSVLSWLPSNLYSKFQTDTVIGSEMGAFQSARFLYKLSLREFKKYTAGVIWWKNCSLHQRYISWILSMITYINIWHFGRLPFPNQ